MASPFILQFKPGVQRDGTELDSDSYLDSLWCRWRLGQPRKMGGYRVITDKLNGLPRKIFCFYTGDRVIAHVGTQAGIQQVIFDNFGNLISIADRTPVTFVGGSQVGFTMDALFDTLSNVVQIVVHGAQDMLNLPNAQPFVPVIGQIDSGGPLVPLSAPADVGGGTYTVPAITGGIASVQPYLFGFDSYGRVLWSAPNLPATLGITGGSTGAGSARISAQKVVAASVLRGGGAQSPAAVFWTLSEVVTASFVGSPAFFAFNTISPSSSILSSDGVVEYDGLYFWPGVDRFLVFNGTVTEVPNKFNQDWFYDNLTPGQQAKTFGFKVPRYGEIWWCAPMFGATEPSHAVIFNIRENAWYDTKLPDMGRSCGFYAQGFNFPTMGDVQPGPNGFRLWMHETGTDAVRSPTDRSSVPSYFVSPWMGALKSDQPLDKGLSLQQLELDIVQSGDMTAQLFSQANARAPLIAGPTVPILKVPTVPQEELSSFTAKQTNRLIRLKIMSDVLGGNYIFGRSAGHATPSDARWTS